MNFNGKVAIVTGGGGGIGSATARLLAQRGACVTVVDVDASGAELVASKIRQAGGRAISRVADVAEEEEVRGMVQATVAEFGGVDILHNNAAAVGVDILANDNDVETMRVDVWDRTMAVNLRGAMLGCKHTIPIMLKRGGGAIINTASVAGLVAEWTLPAYGASKAGLISLARYVATRYGKQGIRCNTISPGFTSSPNVMAKLPQVYVDINLASMLSPTICTPEDQAHAVAFLASDEARMINGHVLPVDGGALIHAPTFADFGRLLSSGETAIGRK